MAYNGKVEEGLWSDKRSSFTARLTYNFNPQSDGNLVLAFLEFVVSIMPLGYNLDGLPFQKMGTKSHRLEQENHALHDLLNGDQHSADTSRC